MMIKKTYAAVFSPTEGTRRYAELIADNLHLPIESINLNEEYSRQQDREFTSEDLVIFGAPVYAGRLPRIKGDIFDHLHGHGTAAVCIVSYGNREFDDALLEEKDIAEKNGFAVLAAAAWIAPHSFSDSIAKGRPDEQDRKRVNEFCDQISKLMNEDWDSKETIHVPGNYPYKKPMAMPFHPSGNGKCINCGRCAEICPANAITKENPRKTDTVLCIDCLACVKECPAGARAIHNPMFGIVQKKLEKDLSVRKEPNCFYR